jgi:hypothetical protein
MFIGRKLLPVSLLCALVAPTVIGKALVRWTMKALPAAKSLGVSEIAIPWNADAKALMNVAREKGYRVYLEAIPQQAAIAAELARKEGIAGLIMEPAPSGERDAEDLLQKLRSAYPKLTIRLLIPKGKRPQMRGPLVYERDGVLQVSSPTAQPWIDSNLAVVRLAQAFHPQSTPLYTFAWGTSDPLQKQLGPRAEDYALAVAETGAFHADLILDLPESLQKSLASDEPAGWAIWKQVRRFVEFYAAGNRGALRLVASVGIWTDSEENSYEALNLMARHNISFRVLSKEDLNTAGLKEIDVLVVLTTPEKEQFRILSDFATAGGTVVLVNVLGSFPWQSGKPLRSTEQAAVYGVGKGRVIEFSGAVTDPETFAQDIRRLMTRERVPVSLWNSLTTLVIPYRDSRTGQTILELVNYEEEALQVQVQVKGFFASIHYETPESGCCETIAPRHVDGFTEFVVPHLVTGGRVHLQPATAQKDGHAPDKEEKSEHRAAKGPTQ